MTRGTSIYEIRIAKINIPAGTTAITTDLIEDTRFNSSDCGNVICAVQTPDFTNILDQYKALWDSMIKAETQDFEKWFKEQTENFDVWFERIKGQLSEDAAGKLQLEIDNLQALVMEAISPVTTEDGNNIATEGGELIIGGI